MGNGTNEFLPFLGFTQGWTEPVGPFLEIRNPYALRIIPRGIESPPVVDLLFNLNPSFNRHNVHKFHVFLLLLFGKSFISTNLLKYHHLI